MWWGVCLNGPATDNCTAWLGRTRCSCLCGEPFSLTLRSSLSAIVSNAVSDSTIGLDTTYSAGAQPTGVSRAPAIPTAISSANYPALDVTPSVNSTEVQAWIKAIDWSAVPTYSQTTGECAGSPSAQTDGRCWWTCGGCTRETDISECPDKLTWGLSYDDGPSPYTPLLLDYLNEKDLTATFFVVGSRVVSRPEMIISEYMAGHQISIHTWAHPALTTLTNEQIVAELGWTKKAIYDVIGVTPNTFRPPYGDIDDRVRAIAAQMGLTPIMWTRSSGTTFDTTDWNIPGGLATGESALSKFETILETYVPKLDTGFIVLEHDLYQQTVDLAVGYFLPLAESRGYKMESIIDCLGLPQAEAYIETSSNTTTTLITSDPAGSTFFQPVVGTQTGEAVVASTGTLAGSGGSAGASATASTTAGTKSSGIARSVSVAALVGAVLGAIALA